MHIKAMATSGDVTSFNPPRNRSLLVGQGSWRYPMRNGRKLVALVAYLGAASAAVAAVDSRHPFFRSLCTDQQSTGFKWTDGGWTPASFNPSDYSVEKRAPAEDTSCGEDLAARQKLFDPSEQNMDPYSFSYGCYSVRLYAAPFHPVLDKVCWETWMTAGETTALARVDCSEGFDVISFTPEGSYNYARISSLADDHDGRKNSLLVSVGTCKVLDRR